MSHVPCPMTYSLFLNILLLLKTPSTGAWLWSSSYLFFPKILIFPVALPAVTNIPVSNFKGKIWKISKNDVNFEEKRGKTVLNPWNMTKKYEILPYLSSFLAEAHKYSSGGAYPNKLKLSPMFNVRIKSDMSKWSECEWIVFEDNDLLLSLLH